MPQFHLHAGERVGPIFVHGDLRDGAGNQNNPELAVLANPELHGANLNTPNSQ